MAKSTISLDSLAPAVQKILEEYGEEVKEKASEAVIKTADLAVKALKGTSPVGKYGPRKGAYKRGWKKEVEQGRVMTSVTIYNSVYQLTHLLEHGHELRQGGSADAVEHIAPVEEALEENFNKIMGGML